jgi:parallel beta-helix repeat protein
MHFSRQAPSCGRESRDTLVVRAAIEQLLRARRHVIAFERTQTRDREEVMLSGRAIVFLAILFSFVTCAVGEATTVSVRDVGALGDGVTDDTAAIQRAMVAVGDAGVVFFPPGVYRVTQLFVGSRMVLLGAATGVVTLRNTEPSGRNFSGMVASATAPAPITDVEIRNLTFERTVETAAFDEHIYLENCQRVVIENSRFVGRITLASHAQKGVHLRGCRHARIINNVFEDIADNPLALNWLDAVSVSGHHVVSGNVFVRTANGPASQVVVTQSNVTIVGNVFDGQAPGFPGNWIETGAAGGTAVTALALAANSVRGFGSLVHDLNGLAAVGNVLDRSALNVDAVQGRSADIAFVGNVTTGGFLRAKRADHVLIEGNVVTDSTRDGIIVQDASNASILGNRVRRARRSGVLVDGTTGAVVVAHNACLDNGQAHLSGASFGVLVQGVVEATLAGNVCHDTQGAAATQQYGLGVNAAQSVTLLDNAAAGNRSGPYREVSPPAEVRRSGNTFDVGPEATAPVRRLATSWSPPSLTAAAQTMVTLGMPGAELGDPVVVSFSQDLRGLQMTAYVGARNRVTVVLRNGTASAIALAPGRLVLQLLK